MIEDLKKTLWATADKLRANMGAAECKHLVLGLTFLKMYFQHLIFWVPETARWEVLRGAAKQPQIGKLIDEATPGRYVGAEAVEDDEVFAGKMHKLTKKLGEQMAKGVELDPLIRQKLGGLGYEFVP